MTSLLISLGHMRFNHVPLLDLITSIVPTAASTREHMNDNEMMAQVNTLAPFNHRPATFSYICVKHILPNVGLDFIPEEARINENLRKSQSHGEVYERRRGMKQALICEDSEAGRVSEEMSPSLADDLLDIHSNMIMLSIS